MTRKSNKIDKEVKLRRTAEKKYAAKFGITTNDEQQRQMQELMIHQIELEMQNEELELARSKADALLERYTNLYNFAPIPYLTLGPNSEILDVNNAAINLFEEKYSALKCKRLGIFITDESKPLFNAFLIKAFASQNQETCELSLLINGRLYWFVVNALADNTHNSLLVAAMDITEQKSATEIIRQQANYDLLTGLPNRRLFQDRLQQEIKKTHRTKQKFALMLIDIDWFKNINDSFGHKMGDLLLRETAHRLSACIRETDTVARLGGDEFIILLGELNDFVGVERIANCILNSMNKPFQLEHDLGKVSVSIGISVYPTNATDTEELIRKADQAMYEAKNNGRNCRRFFTLSMQEIAQRKLKIAIDLHTALEKKQFWIEYQPIVQLTTGHIHKAEALLRWKHPEYGLINPVEFIPIAEEIGVLVGIGNWMIQEVLQQARKWRQLFYADFQISVNKSLLQFQKTYDEQTKFLHYINSTELDTKSIAFEIPGGGMRESWEELIDKLLELRNQGIQVVLDNFGVGYFQWSYFSKCGIEILKIDQSFVDDLENNSNSLALCEGIIILAHKLNIKVIAVGVEKESQRVLLLAAGCDYGQGYLFSKPVPADEFEKLLVP
jgi:diguanylate cyclase (GGDEF)-like protein